MNDDVLMRRVVEGDDEAFREIVDRYKHPLVNYLTHLTRSRDNAEEMAQEAFVRLYHNAASYREQDRLGPYLYRIATNLVVSQARREKRWGLLLPRFRAGEPEHAPSPDRELLTTEIQRKVRDALDRLPLKYRAPLLLFEMDEWSYEEIAAALEIRIGTVKSRISRARDLLRNQLSPWWIGGRRDVHERSGGVDPRASARERVARIHS